jgi:hypothetical protein
VTEFRKEIFESVETIETIKLITENLKTKIKRFDHYEMSENLPESQNILISKDD